MKKMTLKKGVAVTVTLIALGSTTLFANGKYSSADDGKRVSRQSQGNPDFRQGRQQGFDEDAMGVVTSVSGTKMTIKNADGDLVLININPETMIVKAPTEEEKAALQAEREEMRKARQAEHQSVRENKDGTPSDRPVRDAPNKPEHEILKLSDVAVGSWVSIAAFDTDTTVLEAAHICVTAK
jgi:hypothetical protein